MSDLTKLSKRWMLGVSCYYRLEELANFLQILSHVNFVDIFVWEGLSENSETVIRPYLQEQLVLGNIAGYFSFEANIGANCPRLASDVLMKADHYDLVTITNPDLDFDPRVFNEIEKLLRDYDEVFTVSVGLSTHNLPAAVRAKYPVEKVLTNKRYNIFKSGAHLTTFRASEFTEFLDWRERVSIPFVDRSFETFGKFVKSKVSAATKLYRATHTGWSIADDSEYQALKIKNSKRNFWWLNASAPFSFRSRNQTQIYLIDYEECYFSPLSWHALVFRNDLVTDCSIELEAIWVGGRHQKKTQLTLAPGEVSESKMYFFGDVIIKVSTGSFDETSLHLTLGKNKLEICFPVSSIVTKH